MDCTYMLTCEHAGNEIPAAYALLFRGQEEVLFTHQAIDFGALQLAEHLAAALGLPLYYTTTCRLLVEANRSLDNPELFSAFTRHLPEPERQTLLDQYYFPHRRQVEDKIRAAVAAGRQVIHLALHTFTPVLAGEVRETDIGILFDPARPPEAALARRLQQALHNQHAGRQVRFNAPYPGIADGFPTYLRQKFSPDQYAGFELEVNQKFFLHGKAAAWQQIVAEITAALQALVKDSPAGH